MRSLTYGLPLSFDSAGRPDRYRSKNVLLELKWKRREKVRYRSHERISSNRWP